MSDERLAAAGPRAAGRREEYEQLLRDIGEGVRLHYGDPGADPDLALLQGDLLYARGLVTLAQLGDLDATAELADVISLIAAAHAAGDAELAAAVWRSGTLAVGWGAGERHAEAKQLARAQRPGAAAALLDAARLTTAGTSSDDRTHRHEHHEHQHPDGRHQTPRREHPAPRRDDQTR